MFYNLAIDIGTSSVKVLAVDLSGRTLALERGDYPILTPRPGHKEQDPEVICRTCLSTLSSVLRQFPVPPQAIGLSSAMHSLIALDEEGRPLTNAILWADTRSRELAEELRQTEEGQRIYEATGTPIHELSPLLKIRWLSMHEPALFQRTAYFVDIKSYFLSRLTGELFMDYSMASAAGLFNIHSRDWNADSLRYAGIDSRRLPQLTDTSFRLPEILPQIAREWSIPTGIAWVIGASDGCLANLGSFAFDSHTLVMSTGTSGALRYTSPAPVLNFAGQTFCYYLDPHRLVVGGASNNGGVVVNWFRERFYPGESMEQLLAEAGSIAPTAEGMLFLPWLLGERAPIWDTRASGVFLGIRDTHHRAHFVRAVLEGVALNLYRIFRDVQEHNPEEIRGIVSGGGLSRSREWNQILADVFGLPVEIIGETESSALGAILLAQKATGQIADYPELSPRRKTERIFRADLQTHQRYQELAPITFELYRQLRSSFRALARLGA